MSKIVNTCVICGNLKVYYDYIKSELQGAANRPPDSLDFTLAFMMMGGGAEGTEEGFKTLQKLLVP